VFQSTRLDTKLNEISGDLVNSPLVEHEFHASVNSIGNFRDIIQDGDGAKQEQFELQHHVALGISVAVIKLDDKK
jgi:hypothetical protein